MRKRPEILSPAGSMDALRAAVAAGCDAVYMGGTRFGARAYADNPAKEELVQAIQYCHLHQVKLYMTVNTLLKEQELYSLPEYIEPFYRAGLDAVIVQDVGVLHCLHDCFPDLPLHASTQMTLTMGKAVDEYLAPYGVTRIVPARELSLDELRQLRQDTDREIEVFVHGALCYCYSGQCLMSSMQGGRSGNRGRCAQPCRMPYEAEGKKQYLLSPKELCTLPHIGELIEAGIDSFKIEGRMKRPEYTAFVTAMYRKYRDKYCDLGRESYAAWREKNEQEWNDDLRRLAELYNREGFTDGYLTDNVKDMLSYRRPKHGGVLVGTVHAVERQQAHFRLERELEAQDVVEFRSDAQTTRYEYTVAQRQPAGASVCARFQKGSGIRVGDRVYRTRHSKLLQEIEERYLDNPPKLSVDGQFLAAAGKPASLQCSREDVTVCVEGSLVSEAKNRPASLEDVQRVLRQTGDTPFVFADLQVDLQGELFLPVGELKRLRREALDKLAQRLSARGSRDGQRIHRQRVTDTLQEQRVFNKDCAADGQSASAAVMRPEQLEAVLACEHISEVILRDEEMAQEEMLHAIRQIRQTGKRAVLGLPTIFRAHTDARYRAWFARGEAPCPDGYLIRNLESLAFLRRECHVPAEAIRTDAGLYLMNAEALHWWREQGITSYTMPWELTQEELLRLPDLQRMQWICYGKIPLMVSAQCVQSHVRHCRQGEAGTDEVRFCGERDRRYVAVPYCKNGYTVIYREEPFWICEAGDNAVRKQCEAVRYEFTTETKEEVRAVLAGKMPETVSRGHFDLGIQ